MKKCESCGFENPAGLHICLRCAAKIGRTCSNCSASVPAGNSYCGKCGLKVDDQLEEKDTVPRSYDFKAKILRNMRSLMPDELAQKISNAPNDNAGMKCDTTVLILEILNKVGENQNRDTEFEFTIANEIMRALAEIVYKFEGAIESYSNDGMMVRFGVPLNHENDPERAVRAALEMLDVVRRKRTEIREQYRQDIQIRIGIHTGSIITGKYSAQTTSDYIVVGNTISLATEIKNTAHPGQTLVSVDTYQRTNPIAEFRPLYPQKTGEGAAGNAVYFELLHLRAQPGPMRGLPDKLIPMIGRHTEIEKLNVTFQQVLDTNSSRIVLCTGEPGIGKSRLVDEFRLSLEDEKIQFFQATCASYMRVTPYRILANLIRSIMGVSEIDRESVQIEALQDLVNLCVLDPGEVTASVLHVLGISHIDPVMAVRFRFLEPSMLQKEIFRSLRLFFNAISQRSPLVLVLDDLHWVDPLSSHFLDYFCRSLERTPILLILIARNFKSFPETEQIVSGATHHEPEPQKIKIGPLSLEDTRVLVDYYIADKSAFAVQVKSKLVEMADGNPYHAEELVRYLGDKLNLIRGRQDTFQLHPDALQLLKNIPGTLHDIFVARFDHLSDAHRDVIQKASVLGSFFSPHLLNILCQVNENELKNLLDHLTDREFILPTQDGNAAGYHFKNPILHAVIYQTILKRDAKKYHHQVAEAIESQQILFTGDRDELLAWNYSESNEPVKAIPYLIAAGEKAARHYANEIAAEHYRRAWTFLETYPQSTPDGLDHVQIGLGKAYKYLGDFKQAARILDALLNTLYDRPESEICDRRKIDTLIEMADLSALEGNLDQSLNLLRKGLGLLGEKGRNANPIVWRRLVEREAWVNFRQGNLEEAHNLAELALLEPATQETEDPVIFASLYNTLGGVYWSHARYSEAIESVEHSLSLHRNLGYHWGITAALNNLGVLRFSMNKWPEALAYLEQADVMRQEGGFDPERPIYLKNIGEVLMAMGEYNAAQGKFFQGLELSERYKMDLARTYLELGLCRLRLFEENITESITHLRAAGQLLDLDQEVSDRVADYFILEAQLLTLEGKTDLAVHAAEKALTISNSGNLVDEKIDSLRVLGLSRTAAGQFELAESDLFASIQAAQQSGDRFGEGKGLYDLAKMFYVWSQSDLSMQAQYIYQAERSLEKAIRIFETLGAKKEIHRSQALRVTIQSVRYTASNSKRLGESQSLEGTGTPCELAGEQWSQAGIIHLILVPDADENEEVIYETVNYLMPFLVDIVKESNGIVIRETNGLIVVYGAPIAHEDDAERAVEVAILLINFYTEIYRQTKLPLNIQVGVTFGRIIAGYMAAPNENDIHIAGEPVLHAKELAKLASSSHALVSAAVRNITFHRFEYTLAAPHLLNRLSSEMIYQLEGVREQILPVRGLIGLKTPFLGRDLEFQTMTELCRRLELGIGGFIWMEGEAGIGKSRLMREFSAWVGSQGYINLMGECSSRRSEVPFGLFTDLFSRVFGIQPNYSAAQVYRLIDERIVNWPDDLNDTRPYLEFLLGVPPRAGYSDQLLNLEPEQLRRQLFVAVHRVVTRLSEIEPMLIFLDDLQWIDRLSADLVLYLSYLIGSHRVMFICAYRSLESNPYDNTLAQARAMYPDLSNVIELHPLSEEACYALLDKFLTSANLTDEVKDLIVHQSGGNPYYLEEFVRMLIERDYLRMVNGRLEVNQILELNQLRIPSSLETLIRSRVDALPSSARQLLQMASILGRPFTRDLLRLISDREDVDGYLELLNSRGMLNLASGSMHWQSCHPVIVTVVYNSILRAQRSLLHAKIGRVLEKSYQGTESDHAEELAYHYSKSDEHERALTYVLLAAERAAFRYSTETSISYFTQASDLLTVVPDASERVYWRIAVGLGEVHMLAGNYPASISTLQAGIHLTTSPQLSKPQRAGIFRRMGDTYEKMSEYDHAIEHLNRAWEILENPEDSAAQEEAAHIFSRMAWSWFHSGNLNKAKEVVLLAINFAELSDNLGALAVAENYLGGICVRQGDLDQSARHTRLALSCWEKIGYTWGMANTLNNLGILAVISGDVRAALSNFESSLKLRRDLGDVEGLAIAYNNLGLFVAEQGDFEQAEEHLRKSLLLTRSLRMPYHTITAFTGLAHVLICLGRLEEAAEQIGYGRILAQTADPLDINMELTRAEADLNLALEDYQEAERIARQAEQLAIEAGDELELSAALQIIVCCRIELHDPDTAQVLLERARQAAKTGRGDLALGRVEALAIRISLLKGDVVSAAKHYALAEEIFEKVNAQYDLAQLKQVKR